MAHSSNLSLSWGRTKRPKISNCRIRHAFRFVYFLRVSQKPQGKAREKGAKRAMVGQCVKLLLKLWKKKKPHIVYGKHAFAHTHSLEAWVCQRAVQIKGDKTVCKTLCHPASTLLLPRRSLELLLVASGFVAPAPATATAPCSALPAHWGGELLRFQALRRRVGKSQTTKLLALNELDKSPRSCGKHRRLNTLRKIVIGLGKKRRKWKTFMEWR